MSGEMRTTVVGNLTRAPELRFTNSGAPVVKFAVASTPRVFKDGKFEDGETSFVEVTAWRHLAERIAESLTTGNRVIVEGTFKQRSYQTTEGEKRTVWEMTADSVGAELTFANVKITKAAAGGGKPAAKPSDDPWGDAKPATAAATTTPSAETQRATQPAAEAAPW